MAIIELVEEGYQPKPKKAKKAEEKPAAAPVETQGEAVEPAEESA